MQAVPTLDELVREPARARELLPETIAELLAQSGTARRVLRAARGRWSEGGRDGTIQQAEVRLLTVDEASAKLGVTREWLSRRGKRLGLAVKLGDGTLRFSSSALDAYIKTQTVSVVPTRRKRAV